MDCKTFKGFFMKFMKFSLDVILPVVDVCTDVYTTSLWEIQKHSFWFPQVPNEIFTPSCRLCYCEFTLLKAFCPEMPGNPDFGD